MPNGLWIIYRFTNGLQMDAYKSPRSQNPPVSLGETCYTYIRANTNGFSHNLSFRTYTIAITHGFSHRRAPKDAILYESYILS